MAICKDPRLTYLNDSGYNVVRLPRKGIKPLGVLGKDKGSISYLGTLDQIWDTPNTVPKPGAPNPVVALNGARTSDIKLSFGLDILANALSGMFNAAAPNLKFAYGEAKSVQFKFSDVQSVSIDPFLVGSYLASGDVKSGNPFVMRFFGQPGTEAFVITEVIQSKSISAIGKRDAGTEVSVEVPAIQAILGAKVSVASTSSANTEVTYTGQDYLTFGFKVFGIGISNGLWQVHGVVPGQGLAFAVAGQVPDPIILASDQLLDLDMPVAEARAA